MGRVDVNYGRKKTMTVVNTVIIRRLLTIGKILLGEQLTALKTSLFCREVVSLFCNRSRWKYLYCSPTLAQFAIKGD